MLTMDNSSLPTSYYYRDADYIDDVTENYLDVARFLTLYVQPVLCVFGFIGNSVSCRIFLSIGLRKTSSNIYLASLSATSCLFLISVFLSWLEMVHVPIIHEHVICQMVVFTSYVCSFLNVWFVTFITAENYIVTFHLAKARHFCTVRNAKIGVFIFSLSGVSIYAVSLWISKVEEFTGVQLCTVDRKHEQTNKIFTYIDTAVTLILPSIIIIVLISVILFKNVLHYYFQKCCFKHIHRRLSRKEKSLIRITRVLLAISISYMVFSAPTYGNKLRYLLTTTVNPYHYVTLKDHALQQIFQVFFYCTFCCNNIIYIIFCKNYRSCFLGMFRLKRRTKIRLRNNIESIQRQINSLDCHSAGIVQYDSRV